MKICHVYRTEEEIPPRLVHHVEILDEMYPKLRIDLVRTRTTAHDAPPHTHAPHTHTHALFLAYIFLRPPTRPQR